MRLARIRVSWLLVVGILFIIGSAWAQCAPQTVEVSLSTPVSSRISEVGDPVRAVLDHAWMSGDRMMLPSGSALMGKITAVEAGKRKEPGRVRLVFTNGMAVGNVHALLAMPATMDGWLRQRDQDSPVWQTGTARSTALLSQRIRRKLGSDQAVWAQMLGINRNIIPDPNTDEFMMMYNRRDILLGAGDHLQLRLICP